MSAVPDRYIDQSPPLTPGAAFSSMYREKQALPIAAAIPFLLKGLGALGTAWSAHSMAKRAPKLMESMGRGDWRAAGGHAMGMGGDALFALPGVGWLGRGAKAMGMARTGSRLTRIGSGSALGLSNAAGTYSLGRAFVPGLALSVGGGALAAPQQRPGMMDPIRQGFSNLVNKSQGWKGFGGFGGGGGGGVAQSMGNIAKYKPTDWSKLPGAPGQPNQSYQPMQDNTRYMNGAKTGSADMRLIDLRREVIDHPSLSVEQRYRMLRELDMVILPQTTWVSTIRGMLSPALQGLAFGAAAGVSASFFARKFGQARGKMIPPQYIGGLVAQAKAEALKGVKNTVIDAVNPDDSDDGRETGTERVTRGGIQGALIGGGLGALTGVATGTPDTALARMLVMGALGAGIGAPTGVLTRGKRDYAR